MVANDSVKDVALAPGKATRSPSEGRTNWKRIATLWIGRQARKSRVLVLDS